MSTDPNDFLDNDDDIFGEGVDDDVFDTSTDDDIFADLPDSSKRTQ